MDRKLSQALAKSFKGFDVQSRIDRLESWQSRAADTSRPNYDHTETVNDFYDLSTELARWGWNESFHFAPLRVGESLNDAIIRHERLMINKLQLDNTKTVLDVGCGIGGPMRHVARATGAKVLGVNINEHQIEIGEALNKKANLAQLTDFVKCDFMDMKVLEPNSFDAAYAFESTAHAPDKVGAYEQIFRVLKPGAYFWGQETILTDHYQPQNLEHKHIKNRLMNTMTLCEIYSIAEVHKALERAGFKVLECEDLGRSSADSVPWYMPLTGKGEVFHASRTSPIRRAYTLMTLRVVEALRLVPKGTAAATKLTAAVADASIEGGRSGIFSVLGCFLAQKLTTHKMQS
ncbi:MAG: methyltransferase domain-containing protein [Gammaproteobacteria bacterium]|nr:methyltransferase domain-containing protein [Gammaproteobacteria bacterium]MYF38653.1 methyltransferase domain-containing protein [Gammaproteobacteria bacterium]